MKVITGKTVSRYNTRLFFYTGKHTIKANQFFISILKEAPTEAVLASHKLMIRTGLIGADVSGLYTQMPTGLRMLRKVESIVYEEVVHTGSVGLSMPVAQPAELWQESGRWEFYGGELLRLEDHHDRGFCMGPTCEGVIADTVRKEINSYKQLSKNFYHIQTKFRGEIRPHFGVVRAQEFVMKDVYSFHADYISFQTAYDAMYDVYYRILTRLDLGFCPVVIDTDSIGDADSHEFQMLAESNEDVIARNDTSDYAANAELAPTLPLKDECAAAQAELIKIHTPNVKTVNSLVDFLSIPVGKTLKSVAVEGENEGETILLPLCGDHELNDIKAEKLAGVKSSLTMADPTTVRVQFGTNGGSLGPVSFTGKVYADFATEKGADWVIGANEDNYHYTGFNLGRDTAEPEFVDLRNVIEDDESPDRQDRPRLARGIEVGYVFQLRDGYTQAMSVSFPGNNGKSQIMKMGCYGTGITRIAATIIEQNSDGKGIIWTKAMAPLEAVIVSMSYKESDITREAIDKIYTELLATGVDVLLDDHDERAGVLLDDSELPGIPHRIVIGNRASKEGNVEYAKRRDNKAQTVPMDGIAAKVLAALK